MSTEFDIDRVATLARLKLSVSEKERLAPQLAKIVDYINQLNELDTAAIEPTSHVLPVQNVFREDSTDSSLPPSDYLSLAPRHDKGHYEVPQILG
ncbi:MAG: asparaginyl/glutamyl-tRNA amidotransferase subunit C [Nitrospinae bacterium RIFCSPLOWO2_12_FULL_47_7]|nr:MAG: asparaginyl/glutamyl-tRNA amidotransferase subunit C [Nitrospinae bacterium RIFCSPLOWO2_12_FULL_47_7]